MTKREVSRDFRASVKLICRGRRQSGVVKRGIHIATFNHFITNPIKHHL